MSLYRAKNYEDLNYFSRCSTPYATLPRVRKIPVGKRSFQVKNGHFRPKIIKNGQFWESSLSLVYANSYFFLEKNAIFGQKYIFRWKTDKLIPQVPYPKKMLIFWPKISIFLWEMDRFECIGANDDSLVWVIKSLTVDKPEVISVASHFCDFSTRSCDWSFLLMKCVNQKI